MNEVVLERRAARGPSKYVDEDEARWAKCLHGKRACPPEDCFGVSGYADFLEAIEDPLRAGGDFGSRYRKVRCFNRQEAPSR